MFSGPANLQLLWACPIWGQIPGELQTCFAARNDYLGNMQHSYHTIISACPSLGMEGDPVEQVCSQQKLGGIIHCTDSWPFAKPRHEVTRSQVCDKFLAIRPYLWLRVRRYAWCWVPGGCFKRALLFFNREVVKITYIPRGEFWTSQNRLAMFTDAVHSRFLLECETRPYPFADQFLKRPWSVADLGKPCYGGLPVGRCQRVFR